MAGFSMTMTGDGKIVTYGWKNTSEGLKPSRKGEKYVRPDTYSFLTRDVCSLAFIRSRCLCSVGLVAFSRFRISFSLVSSPFSSLPSVRICSSGRVTVCKSLHTSKILVKCVCKCPRTVAVERRVEGSLET